MLGLLFSYISDFSVMSAPGVCQLPLIILQVPDLHTMVRRCRHNSIAIEVELGDRDKVAVASVEIGESGRHQVSSGPFPVKSELVTHSYCSAWDREFKKQCETPGQ